MKATPILFLLLAVFASGILGVKAQQNSLPEEQLHLRQEVRPYLDSLIIEEPKPDRYGYFPVSFGSSLSGQ